MIKIDFEKTSADGLMVYRDALRLPEDHSYTDEEIESMKQVRFDSWYLVVTTPPVDSAVVGVSVEEDVVDAPAEEDVVDVPVEEGVVLDEGVPVGYIFYDQV